MDLSSTGPVQFSFQEILGDVKEFNNCPLPFGACYSPFKKFDIPIPIIKHPPVRCCSCQAFSNHFVDMQSSGDISWTCTICSHKNNNDSRELHSSEYIFNYPELVHSTVEYLLDTSIHDATRSQKYPPSYIFVIDGTLPKSELRGIQLAFEQTLQSLSPISSIGLIVFTSVVSIYELGVHQLATADIFSGAVSPTEKDVRYIVSHERDPETSGREYMSPQHFCLNTFLSILESVRGYCNKKRDRRRCLGVALEYALVLSKANQHTRSHIILCANGGCSYGPGSILDYNQHAMVTLFPNAIQETKIFYDTLAESATELNVTIDVFFSGVNTFGVQVITPMLISNGGKCIIETSFIDKKFMKDIQLVLQLDTMNDCLVEVRTSKDITPTQIIGCCSNSKLHSEVPNGIALKIVRRDPAASLCIFFQLLPRDCSQKNVYFQFSTYYSNTDCHKMVRVTTVALPLTSIKKSFCQSFNLDLCSIFVGKLAVVQTRGDFSEKDRIKALEYLDQRIALTAEYFKECNSLDDTEVSDRKESNRYRRNNTQNTNTYAFPPLLADLPRRLFDLRRGPLLSLMLQHPDDIETLRYIFLNSDINCARRLISPELYGCFPKETKDWEQFCLEDLPLETISMMSDAILLLDHHTDIILWSGKQVAHSVPDFDSIREKIISFAFANSKNRIPFPRVVHTREGDSMARYLQCRLAPSHKDPNEQNLTLFPRLARMPISFYKELRSKFYSTDDQSLNEYFWKLFRR